LLSVLPELLAMAVFLHVQAHERLWLTFFGAWLPKDVLFVVGTWLTASMGAVGAAASYLVSWVFCLAVLGCIGARIGFATSAPARLQQDVP
jgi:hypothetical protein